MIRVEDLPGMMHQGPEKSEAQRNKKCRNKRTPEHGERSSLNSPLLPQVGILGHPWQRSVIKEPGKWGQGEERANPAGKSALGRESSLERQEAWASQTPLTRRGRDRSSPAR